MPVINARLADIQIDGITRGWLLTSPTVIEAQGGGRVGSNAGSDCFQGEKLGLGIHGVDLKQVNLPSLSRCPMSHAQKSGKPDAN